MNKAELRKAVREKIKEKPEKSRMNEAASVYDKLYQHLYWQQAKIIAVTCAVGEEFPTRPLMDRASTEGKTFALPKCIPETGEMRFYKITRMDQLEDSFFGLKEPIPERCTEILRDQIDLLIVPGLVYDRRGYRIGFGGGYFDRFLAGFRPFPAVSVAFNEQLLSQWIPNEPHDEWIDVLITPDEWIDCRKEFCNKGD